MIEIKLQFTTAAEGAAFLAAVAGVSFMAAPQPDPAKTQAETKAETKAKDKAAGKSASTAASAAASPSAGPSSAAEPATQPAASTAQAQAAEPDEIPYAPLAQRITTAIAASNPNSAANRVELKALFAKLSEAYGTPVKTGGDVRAADRGQLVVVLDKIDSVTEETMS